MLPEILVWTYFRPCTYHELYKFYKNIMYFFPILELMFMNKVKYLYLIINGNPHVG